MCYTVETNRRSRAIKRGFKKRGNMRAREDSDSHMEGSLKIGEDKAALDTLWTNITVEQKFSLNKNCYLYLLPVTRHI